MKYKYKLFGLTRKPYILVDVRNLNDLLREVDRDNDLKAISKLKQLIEKGRESYPGKDYIPISKSDYDTLISKYPTKLVTRKLELEPSNPPQSKPAILIYEDEDGSVKRVRFDSMKDAENYRRSQESGKNRSAGDSLKILDIISE